ncbi:MAG: hypothetical protein M3Q47_19035 [Actinomycetota bacterium]|nr:hypothetical protein [Actinomycetota bacterium]
MHEEQGEEDDGAETQQDDQGQVELLVIAVRAATGPSSPDTTLPRPAGFPARLSLPFNLRALLSYISVIRTLA